MKKICLSLLLCVIATVLPCAAQAKAQTAPNTDKAKTAVVPDSAIDPAEEFMRRYGKEAADSLENRWRDDYMLCTGDETRVSRAQLFRWKSYIDSMVMDKSYPEKFKMFVSGTGLKAHEIRPCEPIMFYAQLEKQIHEMDSIISAQRTAKERAYKDSIAIINELKILKSNPADILNIPAGMSRSALQTILARNKIRTTSTQRYLQADMVRFEGLVVTIAFYFDDSDKYTGYEVETQALKADQLDSTVRGWAELLASAYEKRLGPPTSVNRIGFRDIKQGRLSVGTKWEKGESRPRVLIGLATHDHLYYAKVMVSY